MTKPAVVPSPSLVATEPMPEGAARSRRRGRSGRGRSGRGRSGRGRLGRWLWRAFLALDVPLLLAVAFGLAAAYLHPRWLWWTQLLAIILPYLSLLLAGATAGPVLARRWAWLGLHLLLLGGVAWRLFPPERLASGPDPAPSDLVVMTFNAPQSGPSGDALGDSMVALLEAEQPDLLGIQEAWVEAASRNRPTRRAVHLRAVAERLSYTLSVPSIASSQAAWDRNSTGVPLLVRDGDVEVLEQTAVPLGSGGDAEASMAIRTHFRWQGREAVLYNVHLRSFGDEKPWQDRRSLFALQTWIPYLRQYRVVFLERAAETEQIAAQIDAETLPVLITGDFNSTADNWTYQRLRGDRVDAFRVAGAGSGHTYRSDKPFVRIDFVLADRAWEVTAAEVPHVTFSDHRPVVARLRWRAEEAL